MKKRKTLFGKFSCGSKDYKNHIVNMKERKRLEKDGCHHIKIKDGKVVKYINKSGQEINCEKKFKKKD